MTKISVCMVVRDDLPFLKKSVNAAAEYADQIVVIDTGSKDGSADWLSDWCHPTVDWVYEQVPPSRIPEFGFSFLKNIAASRATGDWIHSLDSDEELDPIQRPRLKEILAACPKDVVSITTKTFRGDDSKAPDDWAGIAQSCVSDDIGHRRIYRNRKGIEWRGYIHEELYQGERNCMGIAAASDLRHFHYTNFRRWGDPKVKDARYCWMLWRAYRVPALQRYTNSWWYSTWVPQNKDRVRVGAEWYEAHAKELDS